MLRTKLYFIRLNFYADKKHDRLMNSRVNFWRKLFLLKRQIKIQSKGDLINLRNKIKHDDNTTTHN